MGTAEAGGGLEGRLARLEAIVQRLDADDVELEEALALFEEGVAHVRDAFAVLEQTRLRVEKVAVDPDGEVRIDPDDAAG